MTNETCPCSEERSRKAEGPLKESASNPLALIVRVCLSSGPATTDSRDGCVRERQESRDATPLLESLACAPAHCEAEGH